MRIKGSMTLEAAFALPLFLFAVINILFAINIIGMQSRINAALHQTGNKMAFAGYVYERTVGSALPDSLAGVAMTHIYARGSILGYVGRNYLEQSCIVGGGSGISFAGSSVMDEGDIIDLQVSYKVKPFSGIMGFSGFSISQRYYGRAWTGYDVTQFVSDEKQEEPMVFITETGTVYHVDRNCTYLNPSVESIPAITVSERRNQSGGKYYPCELCGAGTGMGQVYITEQGSSYHSRINCSGLKRTIYTVPLSQVGGRGRCSKCG
ncbi:MAG: hypothetical protein J1F42_11765 [Lachnospiraceae bacterium]|nr:hypothetical protein [Lachnospiraceae bacterium]